MIHKYLGYAKEYKVFHNNIFYFYIMKIDYEKIKKILIWYKHFISKKLILNIFLKNSFVKWYVFLYQTSYKIMELPQLNIFKSGILCNLMENRLLKKQTNETI